MAKIRALRDVQMLTRQEVSRIYDELEDEEIFTSYETQDYARKLVNSIAGRWANEISVRIAYEPDGEHVAFTDNDHIYVNAGHKVVREFVELPDRLLLTNGLLFHELAHCLYLDFGAVKKAHEAIKKGSLFGEMPIPVNSDEVKAIDEIEQCLKKDMCKSFFEQIVHDLSNIISDSHDENCMMHDAGEGFIRQCIYKQRYLSEEMKPFEVMRDEIKGEKLGEFRIFFNQLLNLAYFDGVPALNTAEAMKDPLYRTLMELRPTVQRAVEHVDAIEMYNCINEIIVAGWPFIKNALFADAADKAMAQALQQAMQQGMQGQSGSSGSGQSQSGQGQGQGGGGSGQGQPGQNGTGNQPQPSINQLLNNLEQSAVNAVNQIMQQAMQNHSQAPTNTNSGAQQGPRKQNQSSGNPNGTQSNNGQSGGGQAAGPQPQAGQNGQDASQSPNGKNGSPPQMAPQPTSSSTNQPNASNPAGNGQNGQGNGSGQGQGQEAEAAREMAEKAIRQLMKQISEHKAEASVESQMSKDLVVLARDAGLNSCHRDRARNITRRLHYTDTDVRVYEKITKEQSAILRSMIRQMKAVFKDMSDGGVRKHQVTGNRFRASEAYRLDGLCFDNKRARNDHPEIAVSVLVDKSGSMGGSRIQAAQKAGVLLYNYCSALKVPCLFAGHSVPNNVHYEVYSDFRHVDKDKYRVTAGLSDTGGCNRDGLALQLSLALLEAQPEPVKLQIIICDGQPNDGGYRGVAAEADLKAIVRTAEKHGVSVIALAIGDDKDRIRNIYGDRFVDISDLDKLPKKMADIVKKRIKKAFF